MSSLLIQKTKIKDRKRKMSNNVKTTVAEDKENKDRLDTMGSSFDQRAKSGFGHEKENIVGPKTFTDFPFKAKKQRRDRFKQNSINRVKSQILQSIEQ